MRSVDRQTFPDWEHIVYNVGAPVGLPANPKRRYYEGEKRGPAADFQAALDLARGEIVVPLADDDKLAPHALETALAAIGDREWLVARTIIHTRGIPTAIRGGTEDSLEMTRQGQYMLGGAVFWRKTLTDRIGGFNSDFDGAADYDLYLRFLNENQPALSGEILYLYNDHAETDTRVNMARQADASNRIAGRA